MNATPPCNPAPAPAAGADVESDVGVAVARHRNALWRYLRVLGADAATADDLVQEACVVVLARERFDASRPGAVFAFLRATARRLYLASRRRRRSLREVAHADEVWDEAAGTDGTGDGYVDALRQCVAELPERSRRLLEVTYAERSGRAATARALGIGENGVKSALRRLRAFLHECIERRRRNEA